MTSSLQVILDKQDLAKENAKQLLDAFGAPFEEAGKILADYKRIVVTEETQTDLMAEAREKRLALKKTRVEVERTALLAPDKEKLLTFSAAMETIRLQKLPAVKTKQAQDVVNQIDEMLTKMQAFIAKRAKEL